MDKYTYSLKVDKIGKLVRQEEYVQAAKIADTMEWEQERNVRLLTAVGEAYEKTGQYAKAIDVMLTAYERATIGKRIMYKLTELAIEANDLEDAETFYKKYLEEAPDENNRFILRYRIAEAKGEDLDKRITILETYKKYEFEEEWACRLAELYQEAGRENECVALCDEIILWFGVGTYVDRAMELKESFRPLTDAQREHRENREYYEARVKAVANEMAEAMEQKTAALAPEQPAEADAQEGQPEEEELPVIAISDETAEDLDVDAPAAILQPEPPLPVIPEVEEASLPFVGKEKPAGRKAVQIPEEEVEPPRVEFPELPGEEELEAELPDVELPEEPAQEEAQPEEKAESAEEPSVALKELVFPDTNLPEVPAPEKAAEEIPLPEEVAEAVPENIREVKEEEELPKMPELKLPEGAKLSEGRKIKEKLRAIPEPAVPKEETNPQDLEDAISAALEAEARKEKEGAAASREPKSREELASTRNLKDILRRTLGNASVPAPENLEPTKEIVLPRELKADPSEKEKPETPEVRKAEASRKAQEAQAKARAEAEAILAEAEKPAEAGSEPIAPDTLDQLLEGGEPLDDPFVEEAEGGKTQIPLADDANVLPVISYEETERAAWEQHAKRRIEEKNPLESREMERCIFIAAESSEDGVNRAVEALDGYYQAHHMEMGPIAKILGEKLNARGLVKSLPQLSGKDLIIDRANGLDNDMIREMLRVIEHLDTDKVFVLMDKAPALEELKQRVRTQLLASTKIGEEQPEKDEPKAQAEKREDDRARKGKKVRPLSFDRMDPRQELSERDFIRYADYFAHELECVIDDSGFEALEDEIDLIRREGGKLLAGEVEDIIEDAAENASRPTVRRVFGAKYDKDGFLILRERDFR